MRGETELATVAHELDDLPELPLRKLYYFHDIQVTCLTNTPAVFTLLDELLDVFPEPARVRHEVCYAIACFQDASYFPVQLPASASHTETIRLVTGTKLRYYVSDGSTTEYQSYVEQPAMNGKALSVLSSSGRYAFTQLEAIEQYHPYFLRRCVFLMALGQLMRAFAFEPCHAAAVTAPWDRRQAALIFGASGSGKTTLSLGCALAGFGMLGDDLVMLGESAPGGIVSACALYPEVSVREGTIALWEELAFLRALPADARGKRHCRVDRVRPGAFQIEAPIALLIFPTLSAEGASGAARLSKAQALSELIERCMRAEKTYPTSQERLFTLLSQLAEQAPGYRLAVARDTREGPALLSSLFAGGAHG